MERFFYFFVPNLYYAVFVFYDDLLCFDDVLWYI